MPPKVMITWSDGPGTEERDGRIMAMPAYIGGEFDVAGLKWIPSVPDNPERNGLPRANALVLLSDRATGLPLAVMDGTVVSAMRTGAVTGLAVRHLAVPGSRVACLLGAGVLAHTQLDALRDRDARAGRGARLRPGCRAVRGGSAPRAGGRPASTCGRRPRPRRRCAARPSSCRRRWRSTRRSRPSGSTRASPSCSCRASTGRSTCTPSRISWSSTTGSTSRRTRAATPSGWSPPEPSPRRGARRRGALRRRHRPPPGPPWRPAHRMVVSPVGLAMDDVAAAWHVLDGCRSTPAWGPRSGCARALRSGSERRPPPVARRPPVPRRAADGLDGGRAQPGRPALDRARRGRLAVARAARPS